jgi:extracellular factor (EF) 3-hydroxypalmitic acid methyl ester biosynthesis protein
MDKSVAADHLISFETNQGVELRATVLRLSRDFVAFEIYTLPVAVRTSEVLGDLKIFAGERVLYSGRGVISQVVKTGSTVVCEAGLGDGWMDVDFGASGTLSSQFNGMIAHWQTEYRILPEYKLVVADMQSFFLELRHWLEQVELGIRATPTGDRFELENRTVANLEAAVMPYIDALFDRFESIAATVEPDQRAAHRKYMRRHLHPLVMCSPFAYRTFEKPLGYAGDYEMVSMMTRPPYEGSTLYSKMLNVWFLRQMPAEAHRNRIDYLKKRILTEALRVSREAKRPARVLNLGCGPAAELQAFFTENESLAAPSFTLIDFNEETLQHAQERFNQLGTKLGRNLPIQFIKKSVHAILKEGGRVVEMPQERQFDLVYCAGLFDYLPDAVCQRLVQIFYSWAASGGLVLVTNVDPSNPIKHGMEHLLDWHLIYRDSRDAQRLKPPELPQELFSVVSETTGVNMFVELRKPAACLAS